ncbi:MAG: MtrB/PioB family outer membrane beta-barrel protein [Deltaproteobacteria bacterium]
MKGIKIIVTVLAILGIWGTAFGEEGKLSGDISLTGVIREGKDTSAKFNEYRDIRDGAYGSVNLKYDTAKQFVLFESKDIFYDTQSYALEGGWWDFFRMKVFYDEIPHNFTYDARSFYSGVGTNYLTYAGPAPVTDPLAWNTFDYTVKRKHMGGDLKFDFFNPFYFDVNIDHQKKAGVYPLGVAGTSPGGIAIELPTNIDYATSNIKLETGYSTKPLFLSVNYLYSRFENGDGLQNFRNPATVNTAAATDTLYLPPENDYHKFGFKGGVALPFHSKFSADLSIARARSSVRLANAYVSNVTAAGSNIGIQGLTGITLSKPDFNGNVSTDQLNLALTSNPVPFLNAKVFYKYYNKDNKSDVITTIDGAVILTNHLFDYRKNIYGIEGGVKLPARLYFNAAYSFTKTEREREDLPENRDHLIDLGLKWSGLRFMSAKVGYEYLNRAADFGIPLTPVVNLEPWVRRFDAAAQSRNTYKASVEFFPWETLSLNVGYKYKHSNYNDTILGLTDNKAHEVNADVDWQIHKRLRLFGYFDFEQRTLAQFQRQAATNDDPATPPTAANFNWTSDAKENSYGYGVGADITIITDKLTLSLMHNSIKSDGTIDYTYLLGALPLPAGRTQDNIDLSAWDNYHLNNYVAKATFQVTKMVAVSATYAFESFSYDDSQYSNYLYVPGTTGYLTGAYADQSYRAHVGFLSVNVKF